ncbi:OmpA family protein [Chitinispirillales bacterium ANBcel5]|uniref:OmpA family protein n=1 Tax=Cellulosispirillum alkaliphilum TaxID=3039283 RepID=UPI002A536898|nr:OmpA family protein [Chitinispirillales bacterium ANBcel5]
MNLKLTIYIALCFALPLLANNSAQSVWEEEQNPSTPVPLSRTQKLESFRSDLKDNHSQLTNLGSETLIPTLNRALSSIESAQHLFKEDSLSFSAHSAFDICSLLTQIALIEMQTATNLYRADSVEYIKDSLLIHLHNLHETINGLERSRAYHLRDQLEETQRLLDEEREAAQKLMEEAQQRFSELQSELIDVREDARGTIISMSDILFDTGESTLTSNLKTNLARIAGILAIYRDIDVIVEGHTDNVGSEEFNQKLSEERAQNVKVFLVTQGVDESRLDYVGHAFHRPVADNSTEEGRAKNRRVDLIIQDSRLN